MKRILALSFAAVLASVASAQSFNIDFDDGAGVGTGVPANTFGGAGLAGTWNAVNGAITSGFLMDILGNNTTVTVTSTVGVFEFNNAGTTGDDELLMDDYLDAGESDVVVNGLADGVYNVIVYAWAPDDPSFISGVTIGGNTQNVGGAWSGSYVAGTTHSLHTNVNVTGGTLTVDMSVVSGFSTVNGMQIEAVPEPATFVALGAGALLLLARRRRS